MGEIMSDKMNAAEAVFGFAAWLTSREKPITISRKHNAAEVADLVKRFCEANNLEEPRDHWSDNLVHPSGECSGPAR
jgi:hypothetical protein